MVSKIGKWRKNKSVKALLFVTDPDGGVPLVLHYALSTCVAIFLYMTLTFPNSLKRG